jgi:hypothetical protein
MKAKSNHSDSLSNNPVRQSKLKENKNEFLYASPAKPLDFSFKDIKYMEDLIKTEARSGVRRPISEIEKEENDKNENNNTNKYDKSSNGYNFEDDLMEKLEKKNKKETIKEKDNDVIEGRIYAERAVENKGKLNKREEEKSDATKKKVKYLNYNNSVILHSNKIKTIQNIESVFYSILPDVDFLINKNRNKIDLIQWIDLSHNHLTEIHSDILKLPFLKILYCHANFIEEIGSVSVLGECKCLLNLTLHGNPIEHIKGYRNYIIELVPSLEKLDYTLVSDKEFDIILHKGSRFGEIRDKKSGKVISYPKIDHEVLKRMKKPKDEEGDKKDEN